MPRDETNHAKAKAFRAFIRDAGFLCVGAKSALSKGQMRALVARDITPAWDVMHIYPALMAFAARYRRQPDLIQSFAVLFKVPGDLNEEGFERHPWDGEQSLADKDAWLGRLRAMNRPSIE
ncbi:YqcI/YcgG family protein [Methylorubrum aminovorans]